jgi:hypothetical protein
LLGPRIVASLGCEQSEALCGMEWRRRRQGEEEARAFLRESRRREIKAPAAAFIEGVRHGHTSYTEDQRGKSNHRPLRDQVKNLKRQLLPIFMPAARAH